MAFTVMTASAGSGKTAALVLQYLSIILRKPESYSSILALTFTNKAAAEMKDRILEYLDGMSTEGGKLPPFVIPALMKACRMTKDEIKANALRARQLILHNYDRFNVSTIDSFVHAIVRSFAFDLHLPQPFEVELEESRLLDIAVGELLEEAGRHPALTSSLLELARQNLNEEKTWRIGDGLKSIARKLFREDSFYYIDQLARQHPDRLVAAKDAMFRECAIIETRSRKLATDVFDLISDWGADYFSYGDRGFYGVVADLAAGASFRIKGSNSHFNKAAENREIIPKGKRSSCPPALLAVEDDIAEKLRILSDYLTDVRSRYALLTEARRNIFQVILINEIQRHLNTLRDERQTVHISEFNRRIAKVIRKQPEPFIYERTGNRYRHIFIDEFQDTSVLQWFNLAPMVETALANGGSSLIVGDPKQAIYRFRSGEPELFTSLPEFPVLRDYPDTRMDSPLLKSLINKVNLDQNFRSLPRVVDFNNRFFAYCRDNSGSGAAAAYRNLTQNTSREEEQGLLAFRIMRGSSNEELRQRMQDEVVRLVRELTDMKVNKGDIAILLRDNASAASIASALLKADIAVSSPESMLLVNSAQVRFLKNIIFHLNNPHDPMPACGIAAFLSESGQSAFPFSEGQMRVCTSPGSGLQKLLDESGIVIDLSTLMRTGLYEACEISLQGLKKCDFADPFLLAFLDHILEQSVNRSKSLSEVAEWIEQHPRLSLNLPADGQSIQLMTVHKAKGLQFPIVIYPISPSRQLNNKEDAWLSIPDIDLPATLVNLSKDSPNPEIAELYSEESDKSALDDLNVHYVACTRAEDALYILSPAHEKGEKSGINAWLRDYLMGEGLDPDSDEWLSLGDAKLVKAEADEVLRKEESWERRNWRDRIHVVTERDNPGQQFGKMAHLFLSGLFKSDEFLPWLRQFSAKNHLNEEQTEKLQRLALRILEREELSWIFDPSLLHRSEISISKHGKLFRPDRLAFDGDEVMLADFKTGRKEEKHKDQIRDYASALSEAGYSVKSKVLIYLEPELEVVNIP